MRVNDKVLLTDTTCSWFRSNKKKTLTRTVLIVRAYVSVRVCALNDHN